MSAPESNPEAVIAAAAESNPTPPADPAEEEIVKLLNEENEVEELWVPYVALAKKEEYIDGFKTKELPYTCSSAYFKLLESSKADTQDASGTAGTETSTGHDPVVGDDVSSTPDEAVTIKAAGNDNENGDDQEDEPKEALEFSSEFNEFFFGEEGAVIDGDQGGVVMGLDEKSATGAISMEQILKVFEIVTEPEKAPGPSPQTKTDKKKVIVTKLINVLKKVKLFTVDTKAPGTGFWVLPNYEKDEETDEIKSKTLDIAARITYKVGIPKSEAMDDIINFLQEQFGLKLPDIAKLLKLEDFSITLSKIVSFAPGKGSESVSNITIKFPNIEPLPFTLYVSQTVGGEGAGVTISLQQTTSMPKTEEGTKDQVEDVAENIEPPADAEEDLQPPNSNEAVPAGDIFKAVRLWYTEFNLSTSAWIAAVIVVVPLNTERLPIFLKFDKGESTFYGGVLRGELPEESNILLPTFRQYHSLPTDILEDNTSTPYVDVAKAFNFKAPKGLPTLLTKGGISYKKPSKKGARDAKLYMEVELTSESSQAVTEDDKEPPAPFNWDKARLIYDKNGDEENWEIHSEFSLQETERTKVAEDTYLEDGLLSLTLSREARKTGMGKASTLHLLATAENINFAMLGKFFDSDISDSMVDILGKITLTSLVVDYTYASTQQASDFLFTGSINIGKLKLDLYYQYASSIPKSDESEAESTERRRQLLEDRATGKMDARPPRPLIKPGPGIRGRRVVPGRPPVPPRTAFAQPPAPVKVVNKKAWSFEAYLSAAEPGQKLGDIIMSITGSDPLPDFLSNIEVPTKDIDKASNGKPLITLKVATMEQVKSDTGNGVPIPDNGPPKPDKLVFVFNVALDILEFSFIQIASPLPPPGNNIVPPQRTRIEPIRIFRMSMGPLPFIKEIPIVNELPQPYQLLTYCFVGGPVAPTKLEIEHINKKYLADSKIYFKAETRGQVVGLRLGHHFIVVNDDECVLDHVFGGQSVRDPPPLPAKAPPTQDGQQEPSSRRRVPPGRPLPPVPAKAPVLTEAQNTPAKGTMQKKTKLLTINGISVQYKKKTIWLVIDATLAMGPVELSLIGFGLGLRLDQGLKVNDIISTFEFSRDMVFQINGVAMNFDQPPVLLAGVFIHEKTDTLDSYRGGIAVGFKPYTFVAVGEYSEVTVNPEDKDLRHTYKSIFIYAKLDGPLIDLAIAIIKGVRLGFGYNSFVRSPTVNELADFPFINDAGIGGAGNNPMKILDGMRGGPNPWVAPKEHAFWFAVGFSVSAFNLLTATAVALLAFSDEGVIVNIFADVICQMPPEVPEPRMCIVYVELLMNAELNFIHDYFFVQAALAPTSFLLVPECHLYGGFAMGTWFGRSDYAGDWVFTVGGYHRKFVRPAHYPDAKRLGIRFNIGDNMSIRGEGYFAITPKCVMGGAMIYVELQVGPVSAHLKATFDAILQFKPLHYVVDVYVEVGVSCRVHILFISFDISIDIGADLHIEGPEFGGVAHVDFWFFGFDVYFGAQKSSPPALTLQEFYDVVAKAGPPDHSPEAKQDSVDDSTIIELKISLEEGAAPAPVTDGEKTDPPPPPPNAGAGSKWRVKGGDFKFRVSSVFAITSATLETASSVELERLIDSHKDDVEKKDFGKEKDLEDAVPLVDGVRKPSSIPMGVKIGDIDSPLSVRIIKEDASPTDIEAMYPGGWQPEFVVKQVPVALWGDPNHPPDALSASDGTVDQQMAVSIAAPLPLLSISKIKPVSATGIQRAHVTPTIFLAATETQNGMAADVLDKRSTDWATAKTAWTAAITDKAGVADSLVKGIMSTLGWDTPAPEVVTQNLDVKPKPWELQQKLPQRLVSGVVPKIEGVEDGLDNYYLTLPRFGVV